MRKVAMTLAAAAALTFGGGLAWQAHAQIERGAAGLSDTAQNFTPIEKAACGPHWGRFCGPWHHRVAVATAAGAPLADSESRRACGVVTRRDGGAQPGANGMTGRAGWRADSAAVRMRRACRIRRQKIGVFNFRRTGSSLSRHPSAGGPAGAVGHDAPAHRSLADHVQDRRAASLAGTDRIGLWELPTGLYFFDPPLEGDREFYTQFYARLKQWRVVSNETTRDEFLIASRHIQPGARVLDVGGGGGNFRRCVPQADYTGLDPNFGADPPIEGVRNETLAQHLLRHAAFYDAVCCFQVVEHVVDPRSLFAEIVQAAKPGGLICIGVPHVPSALTRIPNFLVNAPPHHLTWWTKTALVELAKSAGATVESIENTRWGSGDSAIYWIARYSPIKCVDVHFRGTFKWHAASLIAQALGTAAFMLFGPPKTTTDEGAGLLMIARKPPAP